MQIKKQKESIDKKHRQEQKVKKYGEEKKNHRSKSIRKESIEDEKIQIFLDRYI